MSFTMFWQVLWPLIFGFEISAAIQAVVSKDAVVDSKRVAGEIGNLPCRSPRADGREPSGAAIDGGAHDGPLHSSLWVIPSAQPRT